jgi:hypothetical protein
LIIAYHVYYDYYKIDRNKQRKITVHETDILNSHFTEHFYQQSRLTAVEQITFHDTKINHFTRTNIDHSRLTKIPFPTLFYGKAGATVFVHGPRKVAATLRWLGGGGACVEMKEISLRTFLAGSDFE